MKPGRRTIDSLLSHNGFRIELSTGIVVPQGIEFVQQKTFIGDQANETARLKEELLEWEMRIRKKYDAMISSHGFMLPNDAFRSGMKSISSETLGDKVEDTATTLSAFAQRFAERLTSGKATRENGKPYSPRSIRLAQYVISILNGYILKHGDFDFGKYNLDQETNIGRAVVVRAYDDFIEGFKSYMINDRELGSHTIQNTLVQVKFIITKSCEDFGINISNRYLSKLKYSVSGEKNVVAMSQEQFEWILTNEEMIRADNSNKLGYDQAIDFVIAGMLTAARVGDLSRLTTNNMVKTDGGYILSFVPQKTKNSSGIRVEIPIADRLVNIFLKNAEKYNGHLLKTRSGQLATLSLFVKNIIKRYEIFQNIIHTQDKHGNVVAKPFWMAFKFHSTRASLITYLLAKGEQETIIKSISGHSIDSASFKSYVNVTNSMRQRAMQRLALM